MVIIDLIAGQYDRPVHVVAFNTAEGWSADVSEDVAREVMRRLDLAGDKLPAAVEAFVDPAPRPGSSAHLAAGVESKLSGRHFGIPAHFQAGQQFDIARGGPLGRRLRTQLGYRARSEKCQNLTSQGTTAVCAKAIALSDLG
jgi:hypothetical protein